MWGMSPLGDGGGTYTAATGAEAGGARVGDGGTDRAGNSVEMLDACCCAGSQGLNNVRLEDRPYVVARDALSTTQQGQKSHETFLTVGQRMVVSIHGHFLSASLCFLEDRKALDLYSGELILGPPISVLRMLAHFVDATVLPVEMPVGVREMRFELGESASKVYRLFL